MTRTFASAQHPAIETRLNVPVRRPARQTAEPRHLQRGWEVSGDEGRTRRVAAGVPFGPGIFAPITPAVTPVTVDP